MYYGAIKKCDIANGPGVRVSLFVSGCPHHCHNCFNPETWDYNYGSEFDFHTMDQILELMNKEYISGFTILGGEPLCPENIRAISDIVSEVKFKTKKPIWIYTGYTYEELIEQLAKTPIDDEALFNVLATADVLVDGRFEEDKKKLRLKFRGSENQRIIDLTETVKQKGWYKPTMGVAPALMQEYME